MSSESKERERLPFEKGKTRKKTPNAKTSQSPVVPSRPNQRASSANMPQVVSQRMARRMAVFCGVPSTLGVATFFISYWIVSHHWMKLPNTAVLLVSMGFFGLGVLGLSYGVISASWDENVAGSLLGWQEFTTNFGRLRSAWRDRASVGQKE